MNNKPKPEDYGYYSSDTFEEESGWMVVGGEEAYNKALEEWESKQEGETIHVKKVDENIDCPECGQNCQVTTRSKEEGLYYDGDNVECPDCGMTGDFCVNEEKGSFVLWNWERPIGCGYCIHEQNKTCKKHDPNRNQAKEGCTDYKYFEDV